MPKSGYVYILRCADGSYYTGSTTDMERRYTEHQTGELGGYTSTRLPVRVVFVEEMPSIEEAFHAERQIKGWSRKKKEALIRLDFEQLQALSRTAKKS